VAQASVPVKTIKVCVHSLSSHALDPSECWWCVCYL
jgi:hypothetical protein